jgi:hypothetical protein
LYNAAGSGFYPRRTINCYQKEGRPNESLSQAIETSLAADSGFLVADGYDIGSICLGHNSSEN